MYSKGKVSDKVWIRKQRKIPLYQNPRVGCNGIFMFCDGKARVLCGYSRAGAKKRENHKSILNSIEKYDNIIQTNHDRIVKNIETTVDTIKNDCITRL